MLISSSGDTFHPASVGKHKCQSPKIEEALLVGIRRPQSRSTICHENKRSTDSNTTTGGSHREAMANDLGEQ